MASATTVTEPSASTSVSMPAPSKKSKSSSRAPPGNTGTHIPAPNAYLLAQLARTNPLTHRRTPFTPTPDSHATNLQRLVHHEGNRPPNRKILLHLRLLTYYPPVPDVLPELIQLLDSANLHICRLAHYHIRQLAPIHDPALYRELVETLEREVLTPSPARRAAATKTFARVFQPADVSRATDFVADVFNCIGGARVKEPVAPQPKKVAGVQIPGTQQKDKRGIKQRLDMSFLSRKVVAGESYDAPREKQEKDEPSRSREEIDDGAGGVLQSATGNAEFIKSKFGKMVVGHSVFAALRRINRVATSGARIESYLIDSGLMSVVASTVRHTVALLEWRSTVAPGPVSRYLLGRLPHKNPPANKRLHLEELGARVYYARMLSALAEDPNLSAYIPDEAPKQAKRDHAAGNMSLKAALAAPTVKAKASGLFKFLFNKERVSQVVGAAKTVTTNALTMTRTPRLKRDDPLGVEFAEALIGLLKNASNRVLIEALRGLSRRRWTTWFEAPIPQGALYNSPELADGDAFGGTADAWGIEDDEEEEEEGEDEDELGAFENDVAGEEEDSKGSLKTGPDEVHDPVLDDLGSSGSKEGWFSRLNTKRRQRREARIDQNTPFYLRKVGQGMVPALEVILRRINFALLNDEPVRRFSAADAIIVLARAKIYGHTEADHSKLRKAQSSVASLSKPSSSRALVPVSESGTVSTYHGGSAFKEEKHPFQPLVRPLAELVEEDPNQFVRGRAAVALLFVIASGAGRTVLEPDELDVEATEEVLSRAAQLQKTPLLLRYFRNFVTHQSAGTGVGLKLMSELVDYLVYEVLDVAPELAPSGVELTELWAMTHPTVGVCGRLGAVWEKVLSIGQGKAVGASIFRAIESKPQTERVASAAVIFLRRRTLDLAIITVGTSEVPGIALPEPLPRAVGVEMEKYFSLLWHAALLGPSAECRTFAVEALGGAAVLAGEPFRCCSYERLVELIRMRGFGLKMPAEQVLNCLDMLYFSRERFSEARAQNRIARDGSNKSKKWLELVWRLAAEAASAAQILLGVPPPTGWQPLGPAGATDLRNAEARFGDVRDRQDNEKLKDASVATSSAPDSIPVLAIEAAGGATAARKIGSGGIGDVPPKLSVRKSSALGNENGRQSPRYRDDVDTYSSPRSQRSLIPDDRRRSRSQSPGSFRLPRSRSGLGLEEEGYRRRRESDSERWREAALEREEYSPRRRRATDASASREGESERERQEREDYELARRLQEGADMEDGGGAGGGAGGAGGGAGVRDTAKDVLDKAGGMAERLLKGGSRLTSKVVQGAAKSGAVDRLRGRRASERD